MSRAARPKPSKWQSSDLYTRRSYFSSACNRYIDFWSFANSVILTEWRNHPAYWYHRNSFHCFFDHEWNIIKLFMEMFLISIETHFQAELRIIICASATLVAITMILRPSSMVFLKSGKKSFHYQWQITLLCWIDHPIGALCEFIIIIWVLFLAIKCILSSLQVYFLDDEITIISEIIVILHHTAWSPELISRVINNWNFDHFSGGIDHDWNILRSSIYCLLEDDFKSPWLLELGITISISSAWCIVYFTFIRNLAMNHVLLCHLTGRMYWFIFLK